jgi:uncharacterized damage-inducible protein DinB
LFCVLAAIFGAFPCEYQMRVIARILRDVRAAGNIRAARDRKGNPMQKTLLRLFRYKAWANDDLLKALAQLPPESQVNRLAIKALSHTYVVDRIFAAHLNRTEHAYEAANLAELPGLGQLGLELRSSDQEYISLVSGLSRGDLDEQIDFTFTDGAPGRMTREEMLMHVITHGIGHRGQVSALMLLNSLPPARDGFTTYLHAAESLERGRLAA